MSEQEKFDVPEVLAALEAAVEKRGSDYVYISPRPGAFDMPSCLYTHEAEGGNLTPGCIVGQVFYDLTGACIPLVGADQDGTVTDNLHTQQAFTVDALFVLKEAQWRQDGGESWGEALEAARKAAKGEK